MDKTVIYVCQTEGYTDELYERHFALLPAWRQEKVLKLQNEEKRKESCLAFKLLSYALKMTFGIENFTFTYNEHQKPYLADKAAFFSISHCNRAVSVGVSSHEIGVDIEAITEVRQNVLERMFDEAERNSIKNVKNPAFAFTKLWTEREAFAKCTGHGIWTAENFASADSFSFFGQALPSAYVSVCTQKGAGNIDFKTVSFSEL